jgi:hypothetical protein
MSTASILPNGKNQFEDINGDPLVGGTVTFYEPNTLVLKDTWQDDAQSILNTNPIVLDSRGQAIIYGDGVYRQRVKDSLGNLIWDEETASPYTPANLPPGARSFYDLVVFMEGLPADGEIYPIVNEVRDLSLPIALAGSIITIDPGSLPTAPITITFQKNGVSIGTAAIDTLGNVVVTFAVAVAFTAFDQFSVLWPSPQDATAGNIAMTIVFTVTA